ncbi:bicyclomycin resistance protein [Paenibacillus sp. J31TS4]|uniref:ABC transporter substrate-binding protein n=1 Tax=Paenibacillus sp. J31TS4 TaxID=2807195 RepID=UPI001AFCDDD3|nr:ABC transporter substrate-binding protein [Paenibacillus sp. J31TS4]GIP39087.1 bicyclomycin resistance protein [Paenibacillus sp. J31TS4]
MFNGNMKRLMSTGAAVLSLTMLAACSDNSAKSEPGTSSSNKPSASEAEVYANGLPKNEKVTLKYGFFQGGLGREAADYAIKTFQQKYPNVTIAITASPDMPNILSTKISANNTNDMFDFFNRKPAGDIVALARSGKLEVLDDIWERELPDLPGKKVKEKLLDGMLDSIELIDGKTYEVPTISSFSGLFFNKQLFEKHGWNQNPKTWTEFVQLLETIKQAGVTPITFPGQYPTYYDNAFGHSKLYELAEMNGNLDKFTKDHENFIDEYSSPEMKKLFSRIAELGKKGYFSEGLPALNHTQSQMLVIQGEAAMVSTGSHVENEMKESTPKGFEWGYMAVPMVDSPSQRVWVKTGVTGGMFVWADKPDLNKKWAKEFILWNMTLENQQFTAETGGLPIRKDLVEDSARLAKVQTSLKSVLNHVAENNLRPVKVKRNISLSDPSYKQATKIFEENIPKIFIGKQDPTPILEQADKLMKKALEAQKK